MNFTFSNVGKIDRDIKNKAHYKRANGKAERTDIRLEQCTKCGTSKGVGKACFFCGNKEQVASSQD